jgi:hypothetical protein
VTPLAPQLDAGLRSVRRRLRGANYLRKWVVLGALIGIVGGIGGVLLDLCRVGHGAARTMDGGEARMARGSGRGRQLAGSNAMESITCWSSARSAAGRSAGWFVKNVYVVPSTSIA